MTINICVVLQDDMGGLERDVVVTIIVMPDTINSKPTTSSAKNIQCVTCILVHR